MSSITASQARERMKMKHEWNVYIDNMIMNRSTRGYDYVGFQVFSNGDETWIDTGENDEKPIPSLTKLKQHYMELGYNVVIFANNDNISTDNDNFTCISWAPAQ